MIRSPVTVCTILVFAVLMNKSSNAQEGGFLEALRKRLSEASSSQTDEDRARNRENLKKLFSIISEGTRTVIRSLPEESQQAITERRKAWMDAIASGFGDLKGEDIEGWLDNSDNIILRSLSRGEGSPSINAKSGIDRLSDQWWYSKQNRLLAFLLTQPPEPIVRREDLPGPAVIFVNGIATKKAEAVEMADALAEKLGRRVQLLHNPTILEPPHSTGLQAEGYGTDDLSECLHDRLWPATVVNRLEKLNEEKLRDYLESNISLQGNPTTRQLTHLLLTAREPVTIVSHSQGCLITRNALFSMAMLGQRDQAEQNISWIAAGIPLNDKEISPVPNQLYILDVGDDPVAKIVGLRGGSREYKGTDHSFLDHYLSEIKREHLWHGQNKLPVPPRTKI